MEARESTGGVPAWAERPTAELLRLSTPIAVSMVSYSLMTLVDTLLVGRLGAPALAGVGLGGTATFVLLCFSLGLLRAVKTLVGQAIGAGQRAYAGYIGAGLLAAAALGAATVLLGQLLAWLLPALSASQAAGEAAGSYLSLRILGAPLVLLAAALREGRWALGDSRSPMVSAVTANLVNIGLAWLFIGPLRLGVPGAALATIVAHAAEAAILVAAQRRDGFGLRDAGRAQLRLLLQLGFPTALQFVLEVGSFALLAAMLAALGDVQMAAHQVAIQVIHFSFLPALAVGEAASVLTSQAVGAGELSLVRAVARRGLLIVSIYAGICTVIFGVAGGQIARAFSDDPVLVGVATSLLLVAAVFQLFDAANVIARGVLRGTGDVKMPAVVGIATAWLCTPPLTWLLGYKAGLGAVGGWIGLCAEIVLGACIYWVRLERQGWLPAAVRTRAMVATPGPGVEAAAAPAAG